MRKIVSLLLVVMLCVSFMSSCDSSIDNTSENKDTSQNSSANIADSTNATSWLTGQNVYGMESINFSNGMAIISSVNGDEKNLYGIDKNGNLLYTLENHSTLYENMQFTNGLLYIYNWEKDTISLIDDTGKITTAEELGGTQFVSFNDPVYGRDYWIDMFEDGYIIVNKVITTFQGTTYESAVFDKNLNVVVDYSEELYPVIYDSYADSTYEGQMYIMGHLFWEKYKNGNSTCYALNLQTNEIKEYNDAELENFFNSLADTMGVGDFLKYGFVEEKNFDSQITDLSEVIGLSQYSTIDRVIYINEHLFLAIFSEGYGDVFFTITNELGDFKFEPIKYSSYNFSGEGTGQGSQIFATDKYVITLDTIEKIFDEDHLPVITYKLTTYDINGNMINSIHHVHEGGIFPEKFYVSVNDEAIIFANIQKVTFYDFDLNVLCEN